MAANTLRVAVTQAEPEWLDLQGSVAKTLRLIEEAAKGGAKLVSFPEVWIPGYPGAILTKHMARPVDPALTTRYIQNSLAVESEEMRSIQAAAKEHSTAVVLGFSERTSSNSLYIAQAIISPQGELLLKRRKIKPTHMERTIFGDGSGPDLTTVIDVPFGAPVGSLKVGTLACWEHTQPLLKYNTYAQGEVLHIAMWPPLNPFPAQPAPDAPELFGMTHDGCCALSTTYAIEGGAFVLYTTAVLSDAGVATLGSQEGVVLSQAGGGHAAVIGPDGRRLTEALEGGPTREGILFADLELERSVGVRGFLDVVGHYSRPDLLWLGVDKGEKKCVVEREGGQSV
ncbi:putative nitrilase [Bimuria novae-zelandiae CBS 107.79]|uniref:nitrilase n=1 Tax=Bimuria novae-zelandiae CBS 107.79 TaxID=1447943 RepID=A0A6A5VH82_9PLEO|nr:putative nitrilase [Bimuria novae-zelandiae CBS 107.79]